MNLLKKAFTQILILLTILTFASFCSKQKISQDKSVKYVISWDLTDWDPSTSWDNTSLALSNVYEQLYWYRKEAKPDPFQPALAESYTVSEDGLTWTFKIREGVKFHNNVMLDASHVKKSIERTIALQQGAAFIWEAVESINVLEDYLIEFKLEHKAPMMLIVSSGFGAWIYYSMNYDEIINKTEFTPGKECGTGPYKVKNFVPNQYVVLDKFSDYWKKWSENQIEQAIIRTVNESTTQLQMIRSGAADILRQPPFEVIERIGSNPDLEILSSPSLENVIGLMNTQKKPTDDPKVREALSFSVDYEGIIKNLLAGYGVKAKGPVVSNLWDVPRKNSPHYYSISEAQKSFSASKYPLDQLSLTLSHASGDELLRNIALTLQANLRKIGVKLTINSYPWSTQWQNAKHLDSAPNIFLFYYWPTYPTPYDPLFAMFHSEEKPVYNLSYYSNDKFDALIKEGNAISGQDWEQALKLFKQAESLLFLDIPALYFADLERVYVISNKIENFYPNPAYPNVVFFYNLKLK